MYPCLILKMIYHSTAALPTLRIPHLPCLRFSCRSWSERACKDLAYKKPLSLDRDDPCWKGFLHSLIGVNGLFYGSLSAQFKEPCFFSSFYPHIKRVSGIWKPFLWRESLYLKNRSTNFKHAVTTEVPRCSQMALDRHRSGRPSACQCQGSGWQWSI